MLAFLVILGLIKMGTDEWKEHHFELLLVKRYWQFRLWMAQFSRKKRRR